MGEGLRCVVASRAGRWSARVTSCLHDVREQEASAHLSSFLSDDAGAGSQRASGQAQGRHYIFIGKFFVYDCNAMWPKLDFGVLDTQWFYFLFTKVCFLRSNLIVLWSDFGPVGGEIGVTA